MNIKRIFLFGFALALGTITTLLVREFIRTQQSVSSPATIMVESSTKVLTARQNLPIGHIVEANDLMWTAWPSDDVNDNYIQEADVSELPFVGSVVRHGVVAGEPMTRARIVNPGDRGFMAAVLAPGMRAVAIPVDRSSGVAGFIFPGDRVDVIMTHEIPESELSIRQVSETVLQNVRVLAVDDQTNDQSSQPVLAKTVTIEVTPEIAEKIAVIRRLGTLSLSLRSIIQPDGQQLSALSRDDSMPIDAHSSVTWDSDVSAVLSPVGMNGVGGTVTISRGKNSETIDVGGN